MTTTVYETTTPHETTHVKCSLRVFLPSVTTRVYETTTPHETTQMQNTQTTHVQKTQKPTTRKVTNPPQKRWIWPQLDDLNITRGEDPYTKSSNKIIGITATVLMFSLLGVIVISDLGILKRDLKMMLRNLADRWGSRHTATRGQVDIQMPEVATSSAVNQ